ncbi:MAG: tRNA 2-thiouridine(34) synthase MnmA [Lawsonibacter sp.]|nr:tRNA 2-thiouridine(34) synthase MnmA [Lawsonibacter sp.]
MDHKTAVAMSGGVDSSAAALLLQRAGHTLAGVTLKLLDNALAGMEGESACCALDDVEDARAVARKLGFPHYVFNFTRPFQAEVIEPFAQAYESGRTPNPCVDCNRRLKFGALLQRADELGWDKVATGHYARLDFDAGSGRWLLKKAAHLEKDQSYVLALLTQTQLSRSLFPLGGLSKAEVRAIAQEAGLVNARKGDSQDICFVPDGDYGAFLRRHTGRDYPPGPFLYEDGTLLGWHKGIVDYTVGQRRGLGVSSGLGRLYVKAVVPEDNTVVLSLNDALFARTLTAGELNLIACPRLDGPVRLRAKIRYRMAEQPCVVEQTGEDTIRLTFDSPQRAVTPGQTVVLYDGDVVVGGAVIDRPSAE